MHPPTVAAAIVPWPPWCRTLAAAAYNSHPASNIKKSFFVQICHWRGLTICTANEFVQSHFQDCFLGVLYIKKLYHPPFFVCVWNFFVPIVQIPTYLGSRGLPFFGQNFFLSVCKRCFIRIHVQDSYDFWLLIFLWLVILYLLRQSVVIVTGCHWGFYFPTYNAICGRFWADGTIFLSRCLFFCTDLSQLK